MGQVVSVNLAGRTVRTPGSVRESGIAKTPVDGLVAVGELGLAGDRIGDLRRHGGRDKAVYAYALEDYSAWSAHLGRTLVPGQFGENLTLSGVDVSGATIGEVWLLTNDDESVLAEVTMARVPCGTFKAWMGEPMWGWRFTLAHAPGALLRVLRPGAVAAGARIEVVHRPAHGVRVRDCGLDADPAVVRRLRTSGHRCAAALAAHVDRVLERGYQLRPRSAVSGED